MCIQVDYRTVCPLGMLYLLGERLYCSSGFHKSLTQKSLKTTIPCTFVERNNKLEVQNPPLPSPESSRILPVLSALSQPPSFRDDTLQLSLAPKTRCVAAASQA